LLKGSANLHLQHYDEAVKSAVEGLNLDDEHRYPDLEFVAAMGLLGKHDVKGAVERLEHYLALAPLEAHALEAQRQLAALASLR
jgi:hypothetical protein